MNQTIKMKNILKLAGILSTTSLAVATPQVITFGNSSLAGNNIAITGSPVTYESISIFGGTATGSDHRSESGQIGTFGNANGTFLGAVTPIADASVVSMLGSGSNAAIDNTASDNYGNFVGIHLQFSSAIELIEFGAFDVDGTSSLGKNEWSAAYAYNSVTQQAYLPTMSVAGSPALSLTATSNDVNWGLLGAPDTAQIAFNSTTANNLNAYDQEGQVFYEFGNVPVTDIFVLHGIASEFANNTDNGTLSGITGLSIVAPATAIPEPSSCLLVGLGACMLILRRKR
jgi:hypothetical protein